MDKEQEMNKLLYLNIHGRLSIELVWILDFKYILLLLLLLNATPMVQMKKNTKIK